MSEPEVLKASLISHCLGFAIEAKRIEGELREALQGGIALIGGVILTIFTNHSGTCGITYSLNFLSSLLLESLGKDEVMELRRFLGESSESMGDGTEAKRRLDAFIKIFA